jgi:hypothetical protein
LPQGSGPRTLSAGERSITSGFNRKVPGRNQREFLESKPHSEVAVRDLLMAISGHRTLSEVQRYTEDADQKRLADTGMAKKRGQSENPSVANLGTRSGKPPSKLLKTKG